MSSGYIPNSNFEEQGGSKWVVDGEININGIIKYSVSEITGDSTLSYSKSGKTIIFDNSEAIVVALPDISNDDGIYLSFTNIGAGDVVLESVDSQTIYGESTFTLYQHENISLISHNSKWVLS